MNSSHLYFHEMDSKLALELVEIARRFKRQKSFLTSAQLRLERKKIATLFLEPSTRTKLSFDRAAKELGLEVHDLLPESSSIKKGEEIQDTLHVLHSLQFDAVVIRLKEENILEKIIENTPKIIVAGEGTLHHPTQALLDLLTLKDQWEDLKGKNIVITGDILYSRVAHSDILLFSQLGMNIILVSPVEVKSVRYPHNPQVTQVKSLDECIEAADIVMCLRWQRERHPDQLLNLQDYRGLYSLTKERLKTLNKNALIMHPGPFQRNIEIDDEAISDPRSKIFTQVENGLWMRMAVFYHVLKD